MEPPGPGTSPRSRAWAISSGSRTTSSPRTFAPRIPPRSGRTGIRWCSTPPIAINRASNAFVEFDVYRNLPLLACFYYHLNFRTKNVGDANWGLWQDPTFFVYYGGNKDWIRQRIPLPGAGNHDSLQV